MLFKRHDISQKKVTVSPDILSSSRENQQVTKIQIAPTNSENVSLSSRTPLRSQALADRLLASRGLSLALAAALSDEDQTVQAMDDASPTKWHLAHTTWFYEAFILRDYLPGYQSFDARLDYCFNSYYEQKGERHPRPKRGLLTRPSAGEVRDYRAHVDTALANLVVHLDDTTTSKADAIKSLIELGINHEQQHQELLLTDILALFACNPLRPAYQSRPDPIPGAPALFDATSEITWHGFDGGVTDVGHDGQSFHYDNERPRHKALIQPFELAHRLVTNGEWMAFMSEGGYDTPTLWLSDGWAEVQKNNWCAPGYWERKDDLWQQMTLYGLSDIEPATPVSHVSFYEADAFARWAGYRLPTELEWEVAARESQSIAPTRATDNAKEISLTPTPASMPVGHSKNALSQLFEDVWQWTGSAYLAYPGYRPPEGAVGEYNGKFMSNQYVLRGASALTVGGHSRPTYRNFFYPEKRWQMTGLRLAKDL